MKKLLFRVGLGLMVVLIVAAIGMALFLDSIVKKGLETAGPQATKGPVTVDRVSLSIFSGAGKVSGLTVGNPEGFKTPSAIKAGTIAVQISPGSIFSDKIIVKSIQIDAPEITFEGGLKGSNLGALLANVEAYSSSTAKPGTKGAGKKLQVDEFTITGAKVSASLSLMGGKAITVPIPDIRLANLGTGPEGITAAELAQRMFKEILASATKAGGNVLGKVGETIGGTAKDVGKTAGDTVDKAAKGIGDLFKKK